jgi:hypothetical protein
VNGSEPALALTRKLPRTKEVKTMVPNNRRTSSTQSDNSTTNALDPGTKHQIDPADDDDGHHRIAHDGCQDSRVLRYPNGGNLTHIHPVRGKCPNCGASSTKELHVMELEGSDEDFELFCHLCCPFCAFRRNATEVHTGVKDHQIHSYRHTRPPIFTSLTTIALILYLGLLPPRAQSQNPSWSDPKIPAPFARILEERGQLEFVDQAFDRIAYYSWPAFATEGGGETMGLGYTLSNGERVAYIAAKGRKYREVADTLVDLAEQMGPRPQGPESSGPPVELIVLVVVILGGVVAGIWAATRNDSAIIGPSPAFAYPYQPPTPASSASRQHQPAAPPACTVVNRRPGRQVIKEVSAPTVVATNPARPAATAQASTPTPKPIVKEEPMNPKKSKPQAQSLELVQKPKVSLPEQPQVVLAPVQREAIPAVFDVDRVVDDLERVAEAGWLTRGWTKSGILRDVGNQTEILESYGKYFAKANEVLRSRRDLEQTKREILDFEASQVLRQKRLQIEYAQLEVQQAKAHLETKQANREIMDFETNQALRQKRLSVEYAQLEVQEAKAELEKAEAEAARKAVENNQNYSMPGGREDYDL